MLSGEQGDSIRRRIGFIPDENMKKRQIVVEGFVEKKLIRIADAKEVGVGNPAEETYRYPNQKKGYDVVQRCQ